MNLTKVNHQANMLETYKLLGSFEYGYFKAMFYSHPEELDFIVIHYENKNEEASEFEAYCEQLYEGFVGKVRFLLHSPLISNETNNSQIQ